MASPNPNLPSLRATAADLERRVGKKISRTKSKAGALVAGTEFDPRRGKDVQGLRSRDVAAHIRKLEKFLDRSTQFVGGVRGAPLPRAKFGTYKEGEQTLVKRAAAELAPFANERLPGPGTETIGQRAAKLHTKHPTAQNKGYIPPERQPFNIKDAAALDKLTKANKKRMTKKFAKSEHQRAQEEMRKMVEVFRSPTLLTHIQSLSKGQFDLLWNFTPFADKLSLGYHQIQSKYSAEQEIPESVLKDQIGEANSLIDWAKNFDI